MRNLLDRAARMPAACANLDLVAWQRYGLAVLLPIAMALLMTADSLLYLPALSLLIMACALVCGSGPALTALGVAAAAIYASHAISNIELPSLAALVMFGFLAVMSISLLSGFRRSVRAPPPATSRPSEDVFSNVFDNVPVALMIVRLSDGQLVAVNSAFTELWGYTSAQALGSTSTQMSLWVEPEQLIQKLKANCHSDTQELQARTAAGQVRDVLACVRLVQFRDAVHLLVAAADVTDRNRARELEHMANHDVLTTLPNRLLLESRLQHASNRAVKGQLSAVLCIDLDGFKQVNDTLGHAAGDELLRLAALRMNSRIRSGDTLARVGGDEFVVLLENLQPNEAEVVADELLACIAKPFVLGQGVETHISASIGVSYFDAQLPDAAALACRQADAALYAAKRAGRNVVRLYRPELSAEPATRAADCEHA